MGRSAKLHKRVPRKAISSQPASPSKPVAPAIPASAPSKRKSNLKMKVATNGRGKDAHGGATGDKVLGNVDYVALMMSGRRKAREEAKKMVVD